jgi:hypothetical protein
MRTEGLKSSACWSQCFHTLPSKSSPWGGVCGSHVIWRVWSWDLLCPLTAKKSWHTVPRSESQCFQTLPDTSFLFGGQSGAVEIKWFGKPGLRALRLLGQCTHTRMQFTEVYLSAFKLCLAVHFILGVTRGCRNHVIQRVLVQGSKAHLIANTHSQSAGAWGQTLYPP